MSVCLFCAAIHSIVRDNNVALCPISAAKQGLALSLLLHPPLHHHAITLHDSATKTVLLKCSFYTLQNYTLQSRSDVADLMTCTTEHTNCVTHNVMSSSSEEQESLVASNGHTQEYTPPVSMNSWQQAGDEAIVRKGASIDETSVPQSAAGVV